MAPFFSHLSLFVNKYSRVAGSRLGNPTGCLDGVGPITGALVAPIRVVAGS